MIFSVSVFSAWQWSSAIYIYIRWYFLTNTFSSLAQLLCHTLHQLPTFKYTNYRNNVNKCNCIFYLFIFLLCCNWTVGIIQFNWPVYPVILPGFFFDSTVRLLSEQSHTSPPANHEGGGRNKSPPPPPHTAVFLEFGFFFFFFFFSLW